IDGGLLFAPNGTMLYTRYSMNELGQLLPDMTALSTPLTAVGVSSSVGSLSLVPQGFPGEGNLVLASYNGSNLFQVPYSIGGDGAYVLSMQTASVSVSGIASGPEGITYIPLGSPGFPEPSMAISAYGLGKVVVFEVDANGLPITGTERGLVTGLSGAEGAMIDPVTGHFLFSTFGGGNRVILVKGFADPNDCAGVPFGTSILDECGVCRLPNDPDFNSTCTDCLGVVNGPDTTGAACDDGDASTGNDLWNEQCECEGLLIDCEGIAGGSALPGTACDDGNPDTTNDTWTAACVCEGT